VNNQVKDPGEFDKEKKRSESAQKRTGPLTEQWTGGKHACVGDSFKSVLCPKQGGNSQGKTRGRRAALTLKEEKKKNEKGDD